MTSKELFEKCKELIPGGVNSPVRAFRSVGGEPFFTRSAHGAHLQTCDGKDLIDFVCTWGPALFGHDHPVIRNAIARALENGTCHVHKWFDLQILELKLQCRLSALPADIPGATK